MEAFLEFPPRGPCVWPHCAERNRKHRMDECKSRPLWHLCWSAVPLEARGGLRCTLPEEELSMCEAHSETVTYWTLPNRTKCLRKGQT